MSGSSAEERLRAKVEAKLRHAYPDARIIHELMMEQGGNRLDLAAVMPDRMVVVEIKSEKDVFNRLEAQLNAALPVAHEVWVVVAAQHEAAVELMQEKNTPGTSRSVPIPGRPGASRHVAERNPLFIEALRRVVILVEDGDGLRVKQKPWPRYDDLDPRALLWMLHAVELAAFASPCRRSTRKVMQRHGLEHMTGREIRRATYRALRMRPFARADAPVIEALIWDLEHPRKASIGEEGSVLA